jgi:dTDP-4-dehydrorhamnose 3,5-epimerase
MDNIQVLLLSAEKIKNNWWLRMVLRSFLYLSETASVIYKVDQLYNKESETGIRYDDPTLGC